jgi:signal peptidase I
MFEKLKAVATHIHFLPLVMSALALPAILSLYLGVSVEVIASDSMRPGIHAGDAVVSRMKLVSELEPGEIVLLYRPEIAAVQAHRVLSLQATGKSVAIVTRGDANQRVDEPTMLPLSASIHTVSVVVPHVGNWLVVLEENRMPALIVLFLTLTVLVLITRRSRTTTQGE